MQQRISELEGCEEELERLSTIKQKKESVFIPNPPNPDDIKISAAIPVRDHDHDAGNPPPEGARAILQYITTESCASCPELNNRIKSLEEEKKELKSILERAQDSAQAVCETRLLSVSAAAAQEPPTIDSTDLKDPPRGKLEDGYSFSFGSEIDLSFDNYADGLTTRVSKSDKMSEESVILEKDLIPDQSRISESSNYSSRGKILPVESLTFTMIGSWVRRFLF